MEGLATPIATELRTALAEDEQHSGITRLTNSLSDDSLDIEQLITFLEDTPTRAYRDFAQNLRDVFSTVLRNELTHVEQELGDMKSALYAVLVDMHNVKGNFEHLQGFLTLNYDIFLEHAIVDRLGSNVDYGINVDDERTTEQSIKVLKMHGSFGWRQQWPISVNLEHDEGIWIPPGINKQKTDYPFNLIWGAARELLDCDVLRIIGCNLGPNDWDLISLLFSTRNTHDSARPYDIEVIGWPDTAKRLRTMFPFLEIKWLAELPDIGNQIVGELLGLRPTPLLSLSESRQTVVERNAEEKISNPFSYWLTQMSDYLFLELGDLETEAGIFSSFAETAG